MKKYYKNIVIKAEEWGISRMTQLAIFNVVLVFLVLMRSVGYFQPFFLLTVNMIIVFQLILGVIILKLSSKVVFVIALFFWVISFLLKLSPASFWAERSAVYSFEALVIALFLLIFESFNKKLQPS